MIEGNGVPNLVALVPMRHESERVPGKNYRNLAGKPLYSYILETLRKCPEVEQVVVDTDSPIIREGIEKEFVEVRVLERPDRLLGGDIPMNEVLAHDVAQIPSSFYLQTHTTNPLLKAATISKAIALFFAGYPEFDSLFSVTPMQARLWDAKAKPLNHDPSVLLNTQDLPPVYLENSCLYMFERKLILRSGNRLGERPRMFEISPEEAQDIDTESDFRLAETMLRFS